MQGLDFDGIIWWQYSHLLQGGCPNTDALWSGSPYSAPPNSQRQCFVIPPDGAVNALGETADEALTACQSRCTNLHLGRCVGVNVLPLTPPPLVIFTEMSGDNGGERGIPYGVGNCNASCFAAEPNPAESMVRFYRFYRAQSPSFCNTTNFSFHSFFIPMRTSTSCYTFLSCAGLLPAQALRGSNRRRRLDVKR